MRFILLAVAAAVLAGCGASADGGAEGEATAAVIKAYREGDRPALSLALEQYAKPAAGADLSDPCSLDSYKQRRLEMVRNVLSKLDNPTVLSMSEETRLVHLQNVMLFSGNASLAEVHAAEADCEKKPSEQTIASLDGGRLRSTAKALLNGKDAWQNDLKARTPGDLDARMRQAQDLLDRNNVKL